MNTKNRKFLLLFLVVIALVAVTLCVSACNADNKDDSVIVTWYETPSSKPKTFKVFDGDNIYVSQSDFQREGYIFLGLFDQEDGGSKIVDEDCNLTVRLTRSTTLYAQWEGLPHTLVLDVDEDLLPNEQLIIDLAYGDDLPRLPVPELDAYNFKGWYYEDATGKQVFCTDGDGYPLKDKREFNSQNYLINASSVTLKPSFGDKYLTVVFDYCNAKYENVSIEVIYGEELDDKQYPELIDEATSSPAREVVGWSTVNYELRELDKAVTKDITLYAIWKDYKTYNFYTSTTGNTIYTSVKVHRGEEIDPPAMSTGRAGYEVDGWYASTTLSGLPIEKITYETPSTQNLYPRIVKGEYTITFETFGGTMISDIYYTIDSSTIYLPTNVTRPLSAFLGWYSNENCTGTAVTKVSAGSYGNKTFYAKYKGQDMRINLTTEIGSLSSSYQMVEYGSTFSLRVPSYSTSSYLFVGWFDEEDNQITDGNGKSLARWMRQDVASLHAVFRTKYYVTVSTNVSKLSASGISSYYLDGEKVSLKVTVPSAGYDFLGWYSGNTLLSKETSYSTSINKASISLSVKWKVWTTNVTLYYNNGSNSTNTVTLTYDNYYSLPAPNRSGYTFIGWYNGTTRMTDKTGQGYSAWKCSTSRFDAKWVVNPGTFTSNTSLKITDQTEAKNPYDTFNFKSVFGYSLVELKSLGFTKVKLSIDLYMKEIDDGYQEIFISTSRTGGHLWMKDDIEHGSGKKLTSAKTHTFECTLDLSRCVEQLYVLYGAHGSFDDDWQKLGLTIRFTLS